MEASPPFNPELPSIARTYDYLLGGKDNFPLDREIGDIFKHRFPGAVQIALDNRACLGRAVGFMAGELGIAQFIDLGSGLPTADNVHQIAQRVNPDAKIVYVDNDPVVLSHARALLDENHNTRVTHADIRNPHEVLANAELRDLIDFARPVGIIASAILHHILDEENPLGTITKFRDAAPPGSYLFISSFRSLGDEQSRELEAVMLQAFGRGEWRSDAQIREYFGDMKLTAPGIVPCALWRPDAQVGELTDWQRLIVAGLAGK